ncbi:mRNA-capping enzyme [Galendromus occidentalis]|uniref:mRNA-capping enzyme n=1 Tax=Galendromus occidentalis TaxID=34638 RepID=A0AAJ6QYZ6_9ACAR|nr:mRNA-capping enzyme [Galendromus occidentalis]
MSRDPLALPDRWLHCPKIGSIVEDIFVPFKTPLDERFGVNIPSDGLRWEPKDVFSFSKLRKLEIGAVVDLTNSARYYKPDSFARNNIHVEKIACRGHDESPDEEATARFIDFCSKFRASNPHRRIGVHCTHGFNRTGFLICAYLVEHENWDVRAAVAVFAKARKPGIYKQDYMDDLIKRYGDPDEEEEPIEAPPRPLWEAGNDGAVTSASKAFMEGIPGVSFLDDDSKTSQVQDLTAKLCGYKRQGFPGSQPVSLSRSNMCKLAEAEYRVSWKADGTRYLMLIDGPDDIYFLDRDNAVFKVNGLRFPQRKDIESHLYKTVLDGEMVLDLDGDRKVPRYLIYDIVHIGKDAVGQMPFDIRMNCIFKEIIEPRREAALRGVINMAEEPFALRKKEFYEIEMTEKILAEKFQSQVSHEIDGVIFQPVKLPYISGRCAEILKWKPPHLNSIDFKLKIEKQGCSEGMLPKTIGALYVANHGGPLSYLEKVTPEARALDGKIVECKFKGKGWVIMRERTDKSFPNGYKTAVGVWDSIKYPINQADLLQFIRMRARGSKRKADGDFRAPPPVKQKP